jgi:hypothetical protein
MMFVNLESDGLARGRFHIYTETSCGWLYNRLMREVGGMEDGGSTKSLE